MSSTAGSTLEARLATYFAPTHCLMRLAYMEGGIICNCEFGLMTPETLYGRAVQNMLAPLDSFALSDRCPAVQSSLLVSYKDPSILQEFSNTIALTDTSTW